MADYYPLIAKAVAGLDKSTGEARRALYERARNALVTQLRNVSPALTESDITRERLALEEAIRKVEAEAARKSRFDPPPERKRIELDNSLKPTAPSAASNEETNAEQNSSRPSRTPPGGPVSDEALKGLRHVVADAESLGEVSAPATRSAREASNVMPSPSPESDHPDSRTEPEGLRARRMPARDPAQMPDAGSPRQSPTPREPPPGRDFLARGPTLREPSSPDRAALRLPASRERPARRDGTAAPEAEFEPSPAGEPARTNEFSERDFGPDFDAERNAATEPDSASDAAPRARRRVKEPEVDEKTASPLTRMRERVFAYAAIVIVLAALAGVVVWQWQPMVGAVRGLVARTQTTPTPPQPAPQTNRPKITDRIGSNDTTPAGQQAAADVAQRVVLYEEDPEDAAGKRFVGTAVWRTEQVSPGAGQPPETVVRADIDIPDRKMTMKWSLRRNTDKTLPASHTVEVVFALPPDFPHQGIQNVPGVLMKEAEQQRGVPLSGSAVKVTDGYFLIGLSAVDSEMQRNLQLLKERPWFDVPIVYGDGRRAILAVEKGAPGERAFTDAFAAWKQ